jgi:hypothetical protein
LIKELLTLSTPFKDANEADQVSVGTVSLGSSFSGQETEGSQEVSQQALLLPLYTFCNLIKNLMGLSLILKTPQQASKQSQQRKGDFRPHEGSILSLFPFLTSLFVPILTL